MHGAIGNTRESDGAWQEAEGAGVKLGEAREIAVCMWGGLLNG